jgi:two-component system NarL family response regulator
MNRKVRVLLADDHQMMREGLRSLLAKEPDMDVVGEASDGTQVLGMVAQLTPDVVVMDIGMPGLNGQEATRRIGKSHPGVRVVALSTYTDRRYVLRMLEAGACGYVIKGAASEELLRALRAASRGQHYLCPEVAGVVVDNSVHGPDPTKMLTKMHLGTREREVLQLLAEGLSSPEIALRLTISIKTVDTHRRNIMAKLDIHSVAELTKFAVREGLTALEP